jgi:hypothetical protein
MTHKILTIELNDKEHKKYKDWCTNLRKIFGEVGQLTWSITMNGIGDTITVVSSHAPNHPLDLTDIDSW